MQIRIQFWIYWIYKTLIKVGMRLDSSLITAGIIAIMVRNDKNDKDLSLVILISFQRRKKNLVFN